MARASTGAPQRRGPAGSVTPSASLSSSRTRSRSRPRRRAHSAVSTPPCGRHDPRSVQTRSGRRRSRRDSRTRSAAPAAPRLRTRVRSPARNGIKVTDIGPTAVGRQESGQRQGIGTQHRALLGCDGGNSYVRCGMMALCRARAHARRDGQSEGPSDVLGAAARRQTVAVQFGAMHFEPGFGALGVGMESRTSRQNRGEWLSSTRWATSCAAR